MKGAEEADLRLLFVPEKATVQEYTWSVLCENHVGSKGEALTSVVAAHNILAVVSSQPKPTPSKRAFNLNVVHKFFGFIFKIRSTTNPSS